MNIIRTIKCLCCLMKCSKYIYYIKKAICILAIVVTVCCLCSNMDKCKTMISKFRVM